MIWHLAEVWAFLAVAFVVGCAIGATIYSLLADSRLALVQGALADHVGDSLDWLKAALGMGPAWRREHLRGTNRPAPTPPAPRKSLAAPEQEPEPDLEADEFDDVDDAYVEEPTPPPAVLPPPAARRAPPRIEASTQRSLPPPEPVRRTESAVDSEAPLDTGDPKRIAATGIVDDDGVVPRRPPGLARPRGGVQDNLTRIRGVGERNETLLNTLGIFHFGQIAAWTPGEVRWIGQYLAFPERIERDDWVGQAIVLATGGDTGFEKSADRRRRRRMEERMARADAQGAGRVDARSPEPGAADAGQGEGDERWED